MRRLLIALCLTTAVAPRAAAQGWPDETASLAGGRITFGGDVTATVGAEDPGRFTYTDYDRSTLRLIRLGFTAAVRPVDRVTFVAELRAEGDTSGGSWSAIPAALYVRVRPWQRAPLDIQAGRIPPVFGVAGRRVYATDNVLIGYPLAWQYLTVLSAETLPENADDLIYARSARWRAAYSAGPNGYVSGVPLATAFRYDTGVEARLGTDASPVSAAVAVTAGTISNPGVRDSNGGPQFSMRVAAHPTVGLIVGGSYADGRFIADSSRDALPPSQQGGRYAQRTWGADAEYSKGYWLVRGELVAASWTLPITGTPSIQNPLRATSLSVEGRYRVAPGLTAGARIDHLDFNQQRGSYLTLPWDAPVWRVEGGLAWRASRHIVVRGSVQHDSRSRGSVTDATLPSAQVTLWF
jgi:hypothetical protein